MPSFRFEIVGALFAFPPFGNRYLHGAPIKTKKDHGSMITGLYAAATNLDAVIHQQDAIAGNIANAGVSGHKGETVVFRSFPDILFAEKSPFVDPNSQANHVTGRIGTGVGVDWAYMNFQPGPLELTGVPTDLVLDGDGFFVVETEQGERFTRNSKYTIRFDEEGNEGTLVTHAGQPLLGEKGQIKFPADQDFKVDPFGNVVAGEVVIDRLRIETVPDKNVLLPESGALFQVEERWRDDIVKSPETTVRQGYIERSNVNMLVEMARMIESYRNYEAAGNVITTLDRTLDLAVNEIARPV